jgi:hypothetical protein
VVAQVVAQVVVASQHLEESVVATPWHGMLATCPPLPWRGTFVVATIAHRGSVVILP